VEDEAPLRRLGTRVLERGGLAVQAADSAESALALVEAGASPALLVSDVAITWEQLALWGEPPISRTSRRRT